MADVAFQILECRPARLHVPFRQHDSRHDVVGVLRLRRPSDSAAHQHQYDKRLHACRTSTRAKLPTTGLATARKSRTRITTASSKVPALNAISSWAVRRRSTNT